MLANSQPVHRVRYAVAVADLAGVAGVEAGGCDDLGSRDFAEQRSHVLVVPGGVGGCVGVSFGPFSLLGVAAADAGGGFGLNGCLLFVGGLSLPVGESLGPDGRDAELLELAVLGQARLAQDPLALGGRSASFAGPVAGASDPFGGGGGVLFPVREGARDFEIAVAAGLGDEGGGVAVGGVEFGSPVVGGGGEFVGERVEQPNDAVSRLVEVPIRQHPTRQQLEYLGVDPRAHGLDEVQGEVVPVRLVGVVDPDERVQAETVDDEDGLGFEERVEVVPDRVCWGGGVAWSHVEPARAGSDGAPVVGHLGFGGEAEFDDGEGLPVDLGGVGAGGAP